MLYGRELNCMARIENHRYSIDEAFRECFYLVPDYQREYVWTDKEVYQLLEDIDEQIDASSAREYFIGTVLVSPTPQRNHYEVIDGHGGKKSVNFGAKRVADSC
jgi:uncharacterized protein with ParB-like and HNH nuclease domain